MKKKGSANKELCIKLRKKGKSIAEICEVTGLSASSVSKYTSGCGASEVVKTEQIQQYGIALLEDWTRTVNIGRKLMGLEPFPMPVMGDK